MKNNKILSISISITQFFKNNNCTYDETETIIETLQDWIKQLRENNEYNTVSDYVHKHKSKCVDNIVIEPLNHVEGYF